MKKSERTLTPKLRFPEFRNAPEWNEVPLEQIAERITTKNLDGSVARVLTNSAEYGVIDQREYFDKDIANAGNIDGYYIVDLGDFVYNPRISTLAPVGPISRNNTGKGVMSPLYTVFRFSDENTDFYQHYFKTASWHLYLKRVSSMGARYDRMSITTGDFMAMPVPTPLPQEQQKIADCLGSLDGLIAAEGRKLAALQDHKRGLMQQLFPQPGETQPRLRFPEFRDQPEWKIQPLSDICERIMDGTHFSPKTKDGPRPYLTSKNIRNGAMDLSTVTFISEEEHRDIYKRCPVRINDVLLTKDGASTGNCTINTLDYEFSLLSSVAVIRGNSDLLDQQFLYQTITSDRTQQLIARSISGQAITRITLTKLGEYPIAYPSKEEQRRIADCLSALDTQITAQTAKIETLKQHKRGLMQQLFPAPEEL